MAYRIFSVRLIWIEKTGMWHSIQRFESG